VEKDMISRFVKKHNWQVLKNPCPFAGETKRKFVENFLREHIYPLGPKVKKSLINAIFNPKLEYLPKKPKN
jgi:tRNA 2-thiocytidine biosynthesis protein TtcA